MNQPEKTIHPEEERLLDLMIQRSTLGLSDSEQQELERLTKETESQDEPERFESVAAAIDLAGPGNAGSEQLPSSLRDRVLVDAEQFFTKENAQASVSPATIPMNRPANIESKIGSGISFREAAALFVAAASIMLLLTGMNPFARQANVETPIISLAERMDKLLVSQPEDLIEIAWQPIHNKAASGRVIWSDERQEGYMIFKDMKINDPNVEQYQLWIFDTDPGQTAPVDGGVFNITESERNSKGEFIVPIRAHVPIDKAVQFAVTVERPGGVYVSKRENIPVLAALPNKE